MKATIYNQKGKETGTIEIPEKVFNVPLSRDTVHEVIVSMQSNARVGVAHTKDRSEVRGGGKKPWQQKGLGRARHGSRRSPIWRGGGITFGPRKDKDFSRKINKKVKIKALYMIISQKLRDGEVLFVDSVVPSDAKTKNAREILNNLSTVSGFKELKTKKKNAACIYIPGKNQNAERGFSNFGNVLVAPVTSMNPLDMTTYKYIIITDPEKSIAFLQNKTKKFTTGKKLNPKR
ncbi:MAG: 50S ribosomal protein L4 [Parcubacteria group bacterium]|nr:50S ribosomal protein L4 [Parcubacteria group bacterium]